MSADRFKVKFNLLLNEELRDKLAEKAQKNGVSMGAWLRVAIEHWNPTLSVTEEKDDESH